MTAPTPSLPASDGPQRARRRSSVVVFGWAAALLCAFPMGCRQWAYGPEGMGLGPGPPAPIEVPVANPAHVGNVDPDFLWRQIVDTVDDHFRIRSEQPVLRNNLTVLEGNLSTYPEVSGTSLEPWRNDAARGFERLQSTFQTIRRTANVRVVPEAGGYLIDVSVVKEQEDVDQSQFSTAGALAQRHDGTIVRNENQLRQMPVTLGWYEIGRDRDLEHRLMENILGRISNVEPPPQKLLHHSR
ncbi:hypothetical protein [Aureliella helgolandensis]|uniref:Uncharacterized protein n=1 Tax=Aureliella helgolandensis TaxID=2527968 RepID=A0A518G1D2_9BACT|nr:hypothetical protein [Aureliella helgolandensis]QDV22409.1 hypothetical protein Q31a_06940 [Aureliella helgolandensis]